MRPWPHGEPPNRDKLTMRFKPLKLLGLILSLLRDEAKSAAFFSSLLWLLTSFEG
jgi:hypothetical protein